MTFQFGVSALIGSAPTVSLGVLRPPFKTDGELSFRFSLIPFPSFLPMAQNSTTNPVIRSSLERDYDYDVDNDIFLFYPSRPAFESSRDDLFPPVRSSASPRISHRGTNCLVSTPQVSTTSPCSGTIERICRYLSVRLRYVCV